jgi:hypothetical protein
LKVGRFDAATGEHEIDVTDPVGGLQFSTRTLTIKRGEKVALSASIRPKTPEVPPAPAIPAGVTGIDKDWLATVAKLPANEQITLVTARLKALNPGFDGPVTPKVEKGVVVGLTILSKQLTNLVPVRGLPGLRELRCDAGARRARPADRPDPAHRAPVARAVAARKHRPVRFAPAGRDAVGRVPRLRDCDRRSDPVAKVPPSVLSQKSVRKPS